MTLSRNRPVQTRDGREVTIYTWDAPGPYPVQGLVEGAYTPTSWTASGHAWEDGGSDPDDLVQPPPVVVRYVNLYRHAAKAHWGELCTDVENAKEMAADSPDTCISRRRVEFTEGVFDGEEP